MMNAPISMANIEPRGPARFRKVVPGMKKDPQPMMQPKVIAQTLTGVRLRLSFFSFCVVGSAFWFMITILFRSGCYAPHFLGRRQKKAAPSADHRIRQI